MECRNRLFLSRVFCILYIYVNYRLRGFLILDVSRIKRCAPYRTLGYLLSSRGCVAMEIDACNWVQNVVPRVLSFLALWSVYMERIYYVTPSMHDLP